MYRIFNGRFSIFTCDILLIETSSKWARSRFVK
nr:MAG TPA: hypothetical protein [Caudoviricetes sp.]